MFPEKVDPPPEPSAPRGIVKFRTAAEVVPAFVTTADEPAAPVVTVPIDIVAAEPADPVAPVAPVNPIGPCGPVSPVSPFNPCGPVAPAAPAAPRGIVKLNTAAVGVPEFTIETEEPSSPVNTDPNVIVEDPPPEDRPDTAVEIALFLFVTSVAIFASVYEFTDTVFDCIAVLSSALAAITFAEASSAAAVIA